MSKYRRSARHHHEEWQIQDSGDGLFCAACGESVEHHPMCPGKHPLSTRLSCQCILIDEVRADMVKKIMAAAMT